MNTPTVSVKWLRERKACAEQVRYYDRRAAAKRIKPVEPSLRPWVLRVGRVAWWILGIVLGAASCCTFRGW